MPKLIREFTNTVEDERGRSHTACVYADEGEDGLWRGSVVFFPLEGGEPLRARNETTQPNRTDLEYWGSGLTYYFLEGALSRAQRATEPAYRAVRRPEPSGTGARHERAAVVPLSLETADDGLPGRLFRAQQLTGGERRDLDGGGMLVYEGPADGVGGARRHDLSLQFSSRTAAGIAANWFYSQLHGESATLRIGGEPVEVRNDALLRALLRNAERLDPAGASSEG